MQKIPTIFLGARYTVHHACQVKQNDLSTTPFHDSMHRLPFKTGRLLDIEKPAKEVHKSLLRYHDK